MSLEEDFAHMRRQGQFEPYENEIRQLRAKLAKRDEDAQLAGKIGKELLQQNEKSNEIIHALENERARHIDDIQKLKDREAAAIRLMENLKAVADEKTAELEKIHEKMGAFASLGLDQAMKQMKAEISKADRQMEQERERYNALLEDYHELQAKEDVLRSQLREAESFTATLETTSDALKRDKERLIVAEEKNERIERENRMLKEEIYELRNQKAIEEDAVKALKKEVQVQSKSGKMISNQKISLEAEKCDLKRQLDELRQNHQSELQRKANELRAARRDFEGQRNELNQIMTEKKKLSEHCLSLARENQALYKQQEEHQIFLDEARRTVKRLQFEMEQSVDSSPSLLGELEAGLAKRIEVDREKTEKRNVDGMEHCEEYFFLAATAVRIGMAVQYPHHSDPLFQISAKILFEKCMREDVPFHKWHEWLHNQFDKEIKKVIASRTGVGRDVSQGARGRGRGGRGGGRGSQSAQAQAQPPPPKKEGIFDSLPFFN
eukprot:CAMPEP_0201489580 /NCGR_PEP_ID=MMETSP0151_2-20130828/22891_1 /ASSEMBLY_ACC=CAM_ASM_000257 /TAXON_ID=200890 /ORGANISM="Paramoeba atlantica, Strain 621/1 / CCAP 1560/9" /LENGTH=493 /DNA_ID=CAMNT_0047875213 /DNA_START=73 /DNA_END=1554 /DNA_ORIENTATION=-